MGTPADRAEAQDLFAKALKFVDKEHAEREERYMLAISDKEDQKQVLSDLKQTLKSAPNLEWAQWGYLYLTLEQSGYHKDALDALPEGSFAGRILLVEEKRREKADVN